LVGIATGKEKAYVFSCGDRKQVTGPREEGIQSRSTNRVPLKLVKEIKESFFRAPVGWE